MDNQAEVQQDNVSDGAPLLNVQAQQETTSTQTEAPIPLRATEETETSAAAKEVDEAIERPDYFPAQFWDDDGPNVEQLAKSYNELRKQFSQGKHKAPEKEYDISQFADAGLTSEDPVFSEYMAWAKENGISQAAFEDLAGKVLSMGKAQQEESEYSQAAEMQKLGNRAQEKIEFANAVLMKAPISNTEREAIATSLNSAEAIEGFLKIYRSITNDGIPIQPAPQTPEMTVDDLQGYIQDPRWHSQAPGDIAWRQKIEKKWMEQA